MTRVPVWPGYDGYGAIELAKRDGWHAVPSWGRDGWDLGGWPYVIVFTRTKGGPDLAGPPKPFEVAYYVEGDVNVFSFETVEERNEKIDGIAFFHWRNRNESWVEGLIGPKPEHRGPFSWERLEREKVTA